MNASIYAKPKAPRIILRPALATLVLHALMLFALTVNWASQESKVVKVKPAPRIINAKLVDASDLKPKKAPKPVAKPKPRAKPAPKRAPKPVVKPKAVAKPKPAPPKPAPAKPKPEPRMTAAELAELARAELSQAMETEEQEQ
ncbi:MAG: protein TolA, partial [Halioglobus sp.]